jgi:hypothetical protein
MKKVLFLSAAFAFLVFAGCKKEGSYFPQSENSAIVPPPVDTTSAFSFTKLEIFPDVIEVGDYADVYATATGKNLTYTWYIGHGDLFGSGNHIQVGAAPCCVGGHQIKCTVSDGIHSEVRYVWIEIKNHD